MVFCVSARSEQTLHLKAKHRTQLVSIQQVDRRPQEVPLGQRQVDHP